MPDSSSLRIAALLSYLGLGACAGTMLPGEQPAPEATAAPAASAVASPPTTRSAGPGGGPRGGATTAAARGGGEPEEVRPDPLTQARVDCWMMVENKKELRGIDQRIAFIDKCVAAQTKSKPNP